MVGMDMNASVDIEPVSAHIKGMESKNPPINTSTDITPGGDAPTCHITSVPLTLTEVVASTTADSEKDVLPPNNDRDKNTIKGEGSHDQNLIQQVPTHSLGGDKSQDSSETTKDPKTSGEHHDSMSSASLRSSFSEKRSVTPSAQLNFMLNTPPASSSVSASVPASAPPSFRKRDDELAFNLSQARPRSSIPSQMALSAYAQQCIAAAYSSRLNPYALHRDEQCLLQDNLCHLHITTYLNIRNGILRLWTRNPMIGVSEEEALGCAKEWRWMKLASVAYNWLVRNGYINFGCVETPKNLSPAKRSRKKDGPTIVIIGAGMAGLGCARQLQNLCEHYDNETVRPKIIVLEGRRRIGGRIYSHPLQSVESETLPPGARATAEMGAQIVVGFDNGNPLDPIIRAQLALKCHLLRDISTIYDTNGDPVNEIQDSMVEKLYNDILNRSGMYRHKAVITKTAEGDRELTNLGRDCHLDDGITIRQYEDAAASGTVDMLLPAQRFRRGVGHRTADIKPSSAHLPNVKASDEGRAAVSYQTMGWNLHEGVTNEATLSLDAIAQASKSQTLGAVMDEAIRQCQTLLTLTPKDMRLLNWHYANLEYANAANLGKLSLAGWDQDMGNEFEGEHAQVVGGYQQVPRGLWAYPSKLDVRTNKTVAKISYKTGNTGKARIYLDDGEVVSADKVILTAPLGVLKSKGIVFSPPLPAWKTDAINRLGFGIMNKVILVFEKPFWDVERDMIGLLREPTKPDSLSQADYAPNRGKFYLFWNCMKTSGLPMLIALMAGDSAHHAETLPDSDILQEVTSQLRNIYKDTIVPDPLETIITRWGQDKFARGSYSFVAAEALPGDYDLMAKPIGNLFFAGEATCGTHPATVHGAYLSGLRAATEVLESIIGPIQIPTPLVNSKNKVFSTVTPMTPPAQSSTMSPNKRKELSTNTPQLQLNGSGRAALPDQKNPSDDQTFYQTAYDKAMWEAIIAELGPVEPRPHKKPLNPFLYYQKDYWFICKSRCDESRRQSTGNPNAKAPRDEIRQALGQMWRDAPEDIRKPYVEQIEANRESNEKELHGWKERVAVWELRTYQIKDRWCEINPFDAFVEQLKTRPASEAGHRNKIRKTG